MTPEEVFKMVNKSYENGILAERQRILDEFNKHFDMWEYMKFSQMKEQMRNVIKREEKR